jgi:integrase
MTSAAKPRKRARGTIEKLPSGSLRVKVYTGRDPVSKKPNYLSEVIEPGPNAARQAEKARTRLLAQVDEKRAPRTSATVNQLLDKHFELLRVDESTMASYESLARIHIRPVIGELGVGRIDAEVLDSFYQLLRTCRVHCGGRRFVEHRTDVPHDCDHRCGPHKCKPLAESTLRKIDAVLTGAGKRAVRWKWIGVNPFDLTEPIPTARPEPKPPSAEQAAAIAMEAWQEIDWGMLVWLAMVTGARRGELCALTWDQFDANASVLTIASSIAQKGGRTWEKDTKTHQQRRIYLDAQTVQLLEAYEQHCARRAGIKSGRMQAGARIFSPMPDGSTWIKPDTVSQRYARMCARLGWDMNIHQLRHYSATELIAAGVDVRTVAGRLGHGGGGSTTLRVYSAWVSEADQRAAGTLSGRMPMLPDAFGEDGTLKPSAVSRKDTSPYRQIAADLRGAITCGALGVGDKLPVFAVLADRYGVSFGTAQRAVAELGAEGLVTVQRGHRAVVADPDAREELAEVAQLR